jgi:hypothetical protein
MAVITSIRSSSFSMHPMLLCQFQQQINKMGPVHRMRLQ